MVPLTRDVTFLDYLQERQYPLVLVSSPRLGSINHTLSALELAKGRGLEVKGIIYNCYASVDESIANDSRKVFLSSLQKYGFSSIVVDMDSVENYRNPDDTKGFIQLLDIK